MKKILMCIFSVLFCVDVLAAPQKMYIDTEQKYIFTAENVEQTIPEFVEDAKKQEKMAETYMSVMNQETGAVSIADLFEVCRAGGFNTYRQTGYEQCRGFVLKLLENAEQEAEEGFLGGFCPAAYDENGKQQNGLKSINENTRIGDFCSSTNIAGGEVVFRKGYNCTCAAYACNPGFQSEKGACVTEYKDANGDCLRKEYTNITTVTKAEEALRFCESKAVKGCKVRNAIRNFGGIKGRIVCNATQEELNGVHSRNTACPKSEWAENSENNTTAKCQSFCRAKAEQNSCKYVTVLMKHSDKKCICNPGERDYSAANMYKEVCGDDKGKTGKKEYCVTDFFNWTQTQIGQAIGFAQDYARIKHGATIYCSNNHRRLWNDDYVKCATKDGSVYYEFKFDDIRESVDMDRRLTERSALCRLVGGKPNSVADNKVCRKIDVNTCNKNLKSLAQKYGHTVQWANDKCNFTADGDRNVMGTDEFEKSLAKIDGLDNKAFFNLQVIAVRKNFVLEDELEKYVRNKISGVNKFTCDPGYKSIKAADGILARIAGNHDDIKRCYVDGKPIDFVFDDLAEITKLQRDAGESGAKCITSDGKFDGHYCRGLTKSECFELEEKLLTELKTRGWAGDGDLVDWDERAGACELNAAQFARNMNKTGEYVAIAGLTVAGVFTGGGTTAVAIGLMATELAGMAGEIVTERQKELLPQRWANQFLEASRGCKSASCAETTLRSNFGKIQQVQDMLNKDVLNDVDTELARLAELLPDSRFEEIMNSAKAPNCWQTWECQEKIFMSMQMASLAAAVGKGLIKLTKVISRKAGAAAAKKSTALARMSSNVDDAADGAKGSPKGKGPSGDTPGAPHGTSSGPRATGETGGIYDATYFSNNPSAVDDVFKNANDVVQIKRQDMKAATLRDLMRKAEAHGFECSDCGGDILKFSKKVDNTADDVVNGTKNTGKATDGASGVGRSASGSADVGRGATNTSKLTKNSSVGEIIRESGNLSYAERRTLLSSLSNEKKLEIAKLKVSSGEVTLPFGSTVDDLAKNPDLLNISGEYVPINQDALKILSDIRKMDKSSGLDDLVKKANENGGILTGSDATEYNKLIAASEREELVAKLRYTLSNDMSTETLIANAQQYESTLIGVIASDDKMVRQAQNFSKLTKAEQQEFLNKAVNGLNDYFRPEVKVQIKVVDSWTEIGLPAEVDAKLIGQSRGNIIYIKPSNLHLTGMDGDLNSVMALIAHEYGHSMDAINAERVAVGGNAMAHNVVHKGSTSIKTPKDNMEYLAAPTEKSSRAISTVVGENFAKDLEATLKTGTVTTSPLTNLQKYKVVTALTGDQIKSVDKFGVKYYTFSFENADNIGTVMDHFRKVGIEHMTTFEENGEHVLAVFDDASDMKRFEQQIAKATKVTSKVDDVAKGASKVNGVTRDVKNSEQFELVQKKALAYAKQPGGELYYPVEHLDATEWDALNKSIEHTGFKWENQGDGYMKIVREKPIKTGNDLVESLKSRNWLGVKKGGWYYTGVDGMSGGQHATGLKFHISVDASDLDRATDIIGNAIRNSGIGGDFKVILKPEEFNWIDQVGKEFTVYVSKEGYNSGKIQRFITECEEGLKNAGIKNNGFGKNVMGGDKAVEGSQYMHYRYDQLDDLGRPQGFYRSKYDFVAPNVANGGDIMDGIGVGKNANKFADKVADVTKGATNVIETPIEEANKLFNVYGLSLGNINGVEIPMSKFGNGEKTVNELARLVEKQGGYLQQIDDKIVVRKPGKTGWDLRQSLKKHGIISNRYASDTFHEIHIRSGDQCASGLKFHVSVNVEDLEIASYVVDDLVKRTDVADIWKVYSDGMTGSQKGKDFTIYVSQNGYDADKIQGFLKELENELKDRNIRPNGYGNNIATGDKPVSGSSYMYYRYDRTNASGIPDGKYNSSYEFVAPNAEYGGDIMKGIGIR